MPICRRIQCEWPPENQAAQVVYNQRKVFALFLGSSHPIGWGWGAKQSPELTPRVMIALLAGHSPEPTQIAPLIPHSVTVDIDSDRLSIYRSAN